MPRRPVAVGGVTSVTYIDANGTQQTLSNTLYDVSVKGVWSSVRPKWGTVLPQTAKIPNAITITFVAGANTDPTLVSPLAKIAITAWAAYAYENREAVAMGKTPTVLPHSFNSILWMLGSPEM